MKLQASYTLTPQSHLLASYLHDPFKYRPFKYPASQHESYNNDIQIAYNGLMQQQHKPYRSDVRNRIQGISEPARPYNKFQRLKVLNVQASQKRSKKLNTTNKNSTEIAALNLQGKWLEKAEYSIGKRCRIEVYSGMLVITLDEPIKNSDDGS